MTDRAISRRNLLASAGLAATAMAIKPIPAKAADSAKPVFTYCLNMATIRGHKLSLLDEIDTAAKAGYSAVELWLEKIGGYVKTGATLPDLKKRIADLGLTVANAIGFASWIVDDETERAKGLEQAKRDMDTVAQIGCKHIAAPPVGAQRATPIDLAKAAERYRALLDIGDKMGVVPALELWGSSANLHLLGEVTFVAVESGHPSACILADVFHIYKGGSDFAGLKLLSAAATPVFHINDYPAEPPRDKINDSARVYPGDGVAPLTQILRDLHTKGSNIVLSLELFNPDYYKQDPLEVAKTGLAKLRTAVDKAIA